MGIVAKVSFEAFVPRTPTKQDLSKPVVLYSTRYRDLFSRFCDTQLGANGGASVGKMKQLPSLRELLNRCSAHLRNGVFQLDYVTPLQLEAVRNFIWGDNDEVDLRRPTPLPICVECLGTDKCNPVGEEEPLISCYGCGNSVHPSCRVYSADLVHHFEKEGWTCDDCKVCLVCGESQTNEDLIICEYCDQGVHYTCLDPPPEKRPKVWDCDDCLIARGKPPNNNVKKRTDVGILGPPSLAPAEHTKETIDSKVTSHSSPSLSVPGKPQRYTSSADTRGRERDLAER